jgi:hypothetical protein
MSSQHHDQKRHETDYGTFGVEAGPMGNMPLIEPDPALSTSSGQAFDPADPRANPLDFSWEFGPSSCVASYDPHSLRPANQQTLQQGRVPTGALNEYHYPTLNPNPLYAFTSPYVASVDLYESRASSDSQERREAARSMPSEIANTLVPSAPLHGAGQPGFFLTNNNPTSLVVPVDPFWLNRSFYATAVLGEQNPNLAQGWSYSASNAASISAGTMTGRQPPAVCTGWAQTPRSDSNCEMEPGKNQSYISNRRAIDGKAPFSYYAQTQTSPAIVAFYPRTTANATGLIETVHFDTTCLHEFKHHPKFWKGFQRAAIGCPAVGDSIAEQQRCIDAEIRAEALFPAPTRLNEMLSILWQTAEEEVVTGHTERELPQSRTELTGDVVSRTSHLLEGWLNFKAKERHRQGIESGQVDLQLPPLLRQGQDATSMMILNDPTELHKVGTMFLRQCTFSKSQADHMESKKVDPSRCTPNFTVGTANLPGYRRRYT